jgi:hypothetical protein
MTIEELHDSLPDGLRVTPENLRPDVANAIAFLADRNVLIESGMPVPTIEEWRSRGQ